MPASTSGMIINELQTGDSFSSLGIDANNDGSYDFSDFAVELYNNGPTSVLLTGWELWYAANDLEPAQLIATISPAIVPPGGYYTIVSSTVFFNNTANVGAGQEADITMFPSNGSTFALYNPNANEYVLLSGALSDGTSATVLVDALLTAHSLATQSGPTEIYPPRSGHASIQRVTDGSDTWEATASTLGQPNCFAKGTLIATPLGETAIETLQSGDLVRTADGLSVPVRWVWTQTLKRSVSGERAQLVKISAGALGNHADLFVTGEHGMARGGYIINAAALVNGTSIDWVPLTDTPERQTVYHIETDAHHMLLANGAPSESFLNTCGRDAFDNFSDYAARYDQGHVIPESPLPRITCQRQMRPKANTPRAA